MANRKSTGKQWYVGIAGYLDMPARLSNGAFNSPKMGKPVKNHKRLRKCLNCHVGKILIRKVTYENAQEGQLPDQQRNYWAGGRGQKYTYTNFDNTVFCSAVCGEEYCRKALDVYFGKSINVPQVPLKAVARGAS